MQIAAGYAVPWIISLWHHVVIDWAVVVRFRSKQIQLPDVYHLSRSSRVAGIQPVE